MDKTDYQVLAVLLREARARGSAGEKPVSADEMYMATLHVLIAFFAKLDPLFDGLGFQRACLVNGG